MPPSLLNNHKCPGVILVLPILLACSRSSTVPLRCCELRTLTTMRKMQFAMLLTLSLVSCEPQITIDSEFTLQHVPGGTGLYIGGTVPVIPGGCDAVKWNEQYILAKGRRSYYAERNEYRGKALPASGAVYFLIDRQRYTNRQELDPGFSGPLTQEEATKWEQKISQPFQTL